LEHAWGGEIFVPKIPSYSIMDMAEAIAPGKEKRVVGIRPGEKIHEEMITSADSFYTYDLGKYYVILPSVTHFTAQKVPQGYSYNSNENLERVGVETIRKLITEHVDPAFGI
jgi:UDP-N-acetylglucosamine 4,6-dehydratase